MRQKILILLLVGGLSTYGLVSTVTADLLEPCDDVLTVVGTDGNHVCYKQDIATTAPNTTESAKLYEVGGTAFITFDISGYGRHATITTSKTNWSNPLPAPQAHDVTGSSPSPFQLVHLRTPMLQEWHQRFVDNNTRIHAYLSHNWYVMDTSNATTDPGTFAFVDEVAPFNRTWKIQEGLDELSGDIPVLVRSTPGLPGGYASSKETIQSLEGEITATHPFINITEANISSERLQDLASFPSVFRIELGNLTVQPHMNEVRNVTGAEDLHDVSASIAPQGFTGDGVTGMIMDPGFYTEPEHTKEIADSIAGYWPKKDTIRQKTHGTKIFNIVHANGGQDSTLRGMAPNSTSVMAQAAPLSRYAAATDLTNHYGGVFQSHSWGSVQQFNHAGGYPAGENTYNLLALENDLVAFEQDVLIIQSMANVGPGNMTYEAVAKNGISVGGMHHYNNKNLSDDSWNEPNTGNDPKGEASTGPTWDCRMKPDLVAPFDQVDTFGKYSVLSSSHKTSAGAGIVAGAAALVHDMYQEGVFLDSSGENTTGTPSPALAKALLMNSAHSFKQTQTWDSTVLTEGGQCGTSDGTPRPRNSRDIQGAGQPNLTVYRDYGGATFAIQDTPSLDSGDYVDYTVSLPDWVDAINVTLVWTDPPGTPLLNSIPIRNLSNPAEGQLQGTSGIVHRQLVNDLDLVVVGPDGSKYPGNHGRMDDMKSDSGNRVEHGDRLNNVETVVADAQQDDSSEEWTVTVYGTKISLSAGAGEDYGQSYAIVIQPLQFSDSGGTDGGGGGGGCCNVGGDDRNLEVTPISRDF